MKGTKKYSNSTTKKAIDTEKDPYLLKGTPKGRAVCTQCATVYDDKRSALVSREETLRKAESKDFISVLCPACMRIKDDFPGGYVTIKGDFLREHKDELLGLVRNKEDIARSNNPLERVMAIKEGAQGIEITTTTEKFAQMLGKEIHKAFSAKVDYKWSADVKVARITCTR